MEDDEFLHSLYANNLNIPKFNYSSIKPSDVRGIGYLNQLKQVIDADQADIIKATDIDTFLNSFQGDAKRLQNFLDALHKFKIVLEGRIFMELERIQDKIQAKAENLYSCTQLGEIFNVSRAIVNQWVRNGYFPNIVHRGKKNMIRESDITQFVNTQGSKYSRHWQKHLSE